MIGKLIPAGTGFEPGQFSDETPGEEPTGEALEGRVLDLFDEDPEDDFLVDDLDEIDDEELEEELDEEEELEDELDDDEDEDELEIIE
ncbi:MAG: hypothetical protein H0S79_15430 [Anaerolineaceae bacterium]|nr:hypothetical protein [Anaerolineaceae bacterium]